MARYVSPITRPGFRKGEPSPNKGVRYYADTLTREEVLALVDGCNCGPSGLRDRALIVTLYRTGLRISEALGLRLHDVDLERGTLRVRGTKTRTSDRTVPKETARPLTGTTSALSARWPTSESRHEINHFLLRTPNRWRGRKGVTLFRPFDLETEVEVAILGLTLGLPSRCECAAPFEMRSLTLAATLCEWCGGLIRTDQEAAA